MEQFRSEKPLAFFQKIAFFNQSEMWFAVTVLEVVACLALLEIVGLYTRGYSLCITVFAICSSLVHPKPRSADGFAIDLGIIPHRARVQRLISDAIVELDSLYGMLVGWPAFFLPFFGLCTGGFGLMFKLAGEDPLAAGVSAYAVTGVLAFVVLFALVQYKSAVRPQLQMMRAQSLVEFARGQRSAKARYARRAEQTVSHHLPLPADIAKLILEHDPAYRRASLALDNNFIPISRIPTGQT